MHVYQVCIVTPAVQNVPWFVQHLNRLQSLNILIDFHPTHSELLRPYNHLHLQPTIYSYSWLNTPVQYIVLCIKTHQ